MRKPSCFLLSILCCGLSSCIASDGSQGFGETSTGSSDASTSYPNLNKASDSNTQSSWSGPAGASTESEESGTKTEVCPGPDGFESNDQLMDAAALVLDEGTLKTRAGANQSSPDFFVFDAPRADPIHLRASYTPEPGDITDLSLFVYNATGMEVGRHQLPRKEQQEVMDIHFVATGSKTPYYIRVESNSETCTPYTLELDANECTDEYEDNDTPKSAKLLPIDPAATTTLPGSPTVIRGDDDYYEIQALGTDPIVIQSVYTPPSGDTTDLSMYVTDAVGAIVGKHEQKRTEPTESMSVRFMPSANNAVYRVQLKSNSDRCMPYSLEFTPRSCSDAFEDNDNFMQAVTLSGSEQRAKVTDVDEDFFRLEDLGPTGTCIVSYTVDEQSPEDLSLFLYSVTESELARHEEPRSGSMENMVVHWNAGESPAYIKIVAQTSNCTTYRVSCKSD